MYVMVTKNYKSLSKEAAKLVCREILKKPSVVIALPTGDSPKGMYRYLVKFYQQGLVDFSQITTFNLDEFRAGV